MSSSLSLILSVRFRDMASGGNVDLVQAASILSSSLVTLSLGAATVHEALVILFDRLRAPPVADRLCRTSCRRRRCHVRNAADSRRWLPCCCLALMSSLVSCILALPPCTVCDLTLLADLQNKRNIRALQLPNSICLAHVRPPRFRLRAPLYLSVSTLSPKIVLPVRRDCRSSKISYGDSLRGA
jgi:hypothetical protein